MLNLRSGLIPGRPASATARAVLVCSVLLGFCLAAPPAVAQNRGEGQARISDRVNLSPEVYILADPTGRLTVQEILSTTNSAGFVKNHGRMVGVESFPGVTWVRFSPDSIFPSGTSKNGLVLELGSAEIDAASLYVPDPGEKGGYRMIQGYRGRTSRPEDIIFRNFSFSLNSQPDPSAPVFLRMTSFGYNATPVYLWKRGAFHAYASWDSLKFGLAYGVIICMILYNLFICITLRNGTYLAYVIYMIASLGYLAVLNGHLSVITGLEGFPKQALESIFLGLFIFTIISFCKRFCDSKTEMPRMHWVLIGVQALSLLLILLCLLRQHVLGNILACVAGTVGPINLTLIGLIRWRQGYGPAKYFVVANIFVVAGITIYVLWSMGLLPLESNGNIYITMGPALESILLSFALADRIRLLEKEKATLAYSTARYKKASETDPLTGLYNKGYLLRHLDEEVAESQENLRPLSCLIMDVDNFKLFNDTYGHPEGDVVLKSLAQVIKTEIREQDSGYRYGGEEFTIVFPNSTLGQAFEAAERIRMAFAATVFRPAEGVAESVTVSVGLAQLRPYEKSADLIRRADSALYQAKNQGRNRVATAP